MLKSDILTKYTPLLDPANCGDALLVEAKEGVLTLTLNRPKKFNSLSLPMYTKIAQILDEANFDRNIKCVVFKANGANYCAGNDLSNFMKFEELTDPEVLPLLCEFISEYVLARYINSFINFDKPLIACCHGKVIGIGFTILTLFDVVYATEETTFNAPFLSTMQGPEACSSFLFPKTFGPNLAFELLAMGKILSAEEGRTCRFVNEVFSSKESLYEAGAKSAALFANSNYETLVEIKILLKSPETKNYLLNLVKVENKNLCQRWTSPVFFEFVMKFLSRKESKL